MVHYVIGFWCGMACAAVLYVLYRIGKELWFAMEWDVMTQAARKEIDKER